MAHINPFKKMSKKTLEAGINADISSRFDNKIVKRQVSSIKLNKGIGNFLHIHQGNVLSAQG